MGKRYVIGSRFFRGLLILLLVLPAPRWALGQFYPVHATVHLLPPLGPYLSDLSAPGRDRVAITLLNRDLQQPLLRVRLQVRLRAPGLEAATRPEAPLPPLELPAGVPLRLAGAELSAYLAPGALAVAGRLPNGRLPAGPLEVAARALDSGTGRALSGWATARVYLQALDPPMLLAPAAGARLPARTPQHILFRWAPRGPAVGAAYEFELRELPDGDAPPAAAFDYGLEVHRATTRAAQLAYGALEPPLQPGRRYAWRVRLLPAEGAAGAPAHGGLSAVGWFELGGGCDAPAGLRARPGPGRAELSWAPVAGAARYTVACRPRTALNRYAWAETTAEVPRLTLGRLAPGATYEWRVGASAPGDARPAFSGVATFTVPPAGAAAAPSPECGRPAPPSPPRSRAPRLDLRAGDTVIAGGGFRVRVTALRPLGDGWYAGRGTVRLRAIVDAPIAVRFDRLRVNVDGYQIGGLVEAERDGDGGVADLDRLDDGGGAPRPGAPRLREVALGFTLPPAPSLRLDTAARALRVVDAAGQPHTLRLDIPANADYRSLFPMRVTDAAGRAYRVDLPSGETPGDGEDAVGPAGGRGVRLSAVALGRVAPFDTAAAAPGPRVRFGPHPAARFALDPGDAPWYRGAVKLDAFYRPDAAGRAAPWKLVPVGESDPVLARVEGDPLDTAGVRFARADGETVPAAWSPRDSGWALALDAPGPGEAYDLFAARGGRAAGRLRVVAYPRQRHAVTLALVGDAALDTAALSRALVAIYGPAGVEIALRVDGRLRGARGWDLDGDGRLRLPGGGLPALLGGAESEEMRALQRAYRAAGGAAEGPVLFVLGGAAGPAGEAAALAGEMPRGQRFGYLFGGGGPGLARAIAHELGHGLFTLQHTFDPEYGGAASRGQTDNLMDYGSGAALAAFQWAIMARPAALTGWDRAEDGRGEAPPPALARLLGVLRALGDDHIILAAACEAPRPAADGLSFLERGFRFYLLRLNRGVDAPPVVVRADSVRGDIRPGVPIDLPVKGCLLIRNGDDPRDSTPVVCRLDPARYPEACDPAGLIRAAGLKARLLEDIARCPGGGGTPPDSTEFARAAAAVDRALQNPFYADVRLRATVISADSTRRVEMAARSRPDEATDLTLEIRLTPAGGAEIAIRASDSYLAEYVPRWQREADARGIAVDVDSLRRQTLADLESSATARTLWEELAQRIRASLSARVGTLTEALLATQKIARHVWAEGRINRSVWYSRDAEHREWPPYAQLPPAVGGAADGAIDEIVGIPLALKGLYGLVSDPAQREALGRLFSPEGLGALWASLRQEADSVVGDPERGAHFIAQTAVEVAAMALPGGALGKGGKLAETTERAARAVGKALPAPVVATLKRIKDANRYNPRVLKAVEAFLEKTDRTLLDKLADIPGFDKVLEDMAQQGGKFVGGRFLLEYFAQLADQFDDVAFEVSTALMVNGKNVGRIYDAVVHVGGQEIRFELKCWSRWAHWSDGAFRGQFLKDLASMAKGNPVKWVFDGSKLDRATIKRHVLEAMREPGFRREVDEVLKGKNVGEQFQKLLKQEIMDSDQLLGALENDQVFDIIFEIAE